MSITKISGKKKIPEMLRLLKSPFCEIFVLNFGQFQYKVGKIETFKHLKNMFFQKIKKTIQ